MLECEHGQLARSCYICELEQRITELEQELSGMTLLYHTSVRCECSDDEACLHVKRAIAAETELERYKAGLEEGVYIRVEDDNGYEATAIEVNWNPDLVGKHVRMIVLPEEG